MPKSVYKMIIITALSVLVAVFALAAIIPGAIVAAWHVISWLLSAGLIAFVIEEIEELDTGIVALAIVMLMLSGIALCALVGLSWTVTLVLAFPLLSTIGLLLARSHQH